MDGRVEATSTASTTIATKRQFHAIAMLYLRKVGSKVDVFMIQTKYKVCIIYKV